MSPLIIITARTEYRRGASLFCRRISGNKGEELPGGFGLLATVVVIVAGMALNALSDANDEFSRYVNGVNARARELVAEIARVETSYGPVALRIASLAQSGKKDEAIAEMNDHCRPLLAELVSATNAYASFTHERERMIAQTFADRYAFDRNVLTAISVFAIVAAFRMRPARAARGVRSLRDEARDDRRARHACMPHARHVTSRHVGRTRVARRIVLHATYT